MRYASAREALDAAEREVKRLEDLSGLARKKPIDGDIGMLERILVALLYFGLFVVAVGATWGLIATWPPN